MKTYRTVRPVWAGRASCLTGAVLVATSITATLAACRRIGDNTIVWIFRVPFRVLELLAILKMHRALPLLVNAMNFPCAIVVHRTIPYDGSQSAVDFQVVASNANLKMVFLVWEQRWNPKSELAKSFWGWQIDCKRQFVCAATLTTLPTSLLVTGGHAS